MSWNPQIDHQYYEHLDLKHAATAIDDAAELTRNSKSPLAWVARKLLALVAWWARRRSQRLAKEDK
jgi:hypothetical protein